MKQFDDDLETINEWRAVFYNAEDVAENGDHAKFDTTAWHTERNLTIEQKTELANKYALEKGFDTFEIEIKREELRTLRFNTEATE